MKTKTILFFLVITFQIFSNALYSTDAVSDKENRPNIVWIVTEDNSYHYLKLYDPKGAPMPNVERLADQGIIFNNAYANAPVCSVARSTLISGSYAPRLGAQYHRKLKPVSLPEGLHMFPWYLRQAGYYTTNNSKEDYNITKEGNEWDMSSNKATYRNRKAGQPFFHVQNFGTTHEGHLHFTKEHMMEHPTKTDPNSVTVFPQHPDSKIFRYSNAYYRDLHIQVDGEIGEFLKKLEDDGLMDDTIIFYYGDHGGVLPGSKGYANEQGLHVPLVVYIPEKWKHLFPAKKGSYIDPIVSFIDFGPTVLKLAGIDTPKEMDGRPFLGEGIGEKELESFDTFYGYADRFDEKYDFVRTIRKGKYKYVRNYQPFNHDGLHNFYRYRQLAYKDWLNAHQKGELTHTQSRFFMMKDAEELYNLEKDPLETNNLATQASYSSDLKSLRNLLAEQVKELPDLSFYPESYLIDNAWDNPTEFGQNSKDSIAQLVEIADLQLKNWKDAKGSIIEALKSKNEWERYWGVIALSSFNKTPKKMVKQIKKMAKQDSCNLVKTRAAEYLGLKQLEDPRPLLYQCLKESHSSNEALLILNTIALLQESHPEQVFEIDQAWFDPSWMEPSKGVIHRLEYLETFQKKERNNPL